MRVKQSEGRIIADRADVAEMIGEPFEFRHQGTEISRARRNGNFECRFHGGGKGPSIGDRAVARDPAGKARSLIERRIHHQPIDAFVHIAEPFFEPHDNFAIGGKAKMAGLDNAGMHGSHRNLMQRFAVCRQKCVRRAGRVGRLRVPTRIFNAEAAVIEPRALIRRTLWRESEEIVDRAFEPQGGQMNARDRWEMSVGAGETEDRNLERLVERDRHMDGPRIGPKAHEIALALGDLARRADP